MDVITYTLKDGKKTSDKYYKDIEAFTNKVLDEATHFVNPLVQEFMLFVEKADKKRLRTSNECVLECLTLGVLWNVYGRRAIHMSNVAGQFLTALSNLRQNFYNFKSGIDIIKGIMSTLFLYPQTHKTAKNPTLKHLKQLTSWLQASGEFIQEVKRLKLWIEFLSSCSPSKRLDYINNLMSFTHWFDVNSQKALEVYTYNVNNFLEGKYSSHLWKEDIIFCGRQPVEYHLNMVGAEILNTEYRKEFLNSKRKVVLLPTCMRIQPADKCMAKSKPMGLSCTNCTCGCSVNSVATLGDKYGFEVYIIPHESSAFSTAMKKGEVSVIGIACVTRLIAGGWMAKELEMPPQCVLLDYCGCKSHWDDNGIVTTINMAQLKRVLGIGDENRAE